MPSNIEIKAKVEDPDRLRALAEQIATEPAQVLHQEDIFFNSRRGRLKLRIFAENAGQLIYYDRPDNKYSTQSNYEIQTTSTPRQLERVLDTALGKTITVIKRREVYIVGQTRVHLDNVNGLGTFMELEVVLETDQDPSQGKEIARNLMRKLQISKADLISCAYADLLAQKATM